MAFHQKHRAPLHHVHTESDAITTHEKHVLTLPHSHSEGDAEKAGVSTPMLRKRGLLKVDEDFYSSTHSLTWAGQQSHVTGHAASTDDVTGGEGVIIAPTGRVTCQLATAAFLVVFGTSVPHGWNTGVLNNPSQLIKDFLNATYTERSGEVPEDQLINLLWSISVSIYLVGGCGGAFCAGWFGNKLGRKKAILMLNVFGYVATVLFATCKVANSFEMLIIGRFIVGFGCGAGTGLVPMYLTEISPVNLRGSMGVLHQFGITTGILLSQIFGLRQILGQEHLWPYLLAMTGIPCFVSCIGLPFSPESPRFLFNNRNDETAAEKALKDFRQEEDVSLDLNEMRQEVALQQQHPEWSFKQLFNSKDLSMQLALVCSLACAQQMSGINVVFYYSTGIFLSANISAQYTQYATLCTGFINALMTGVSVPLMEKAGRRKLLLGGMICMVFWSIIMTIALNLKDYVSWMPYISILAIVGFVIGFSIGLGSIPQFIGGELFKQGPRPPAMSFAGLLNWLCNCIVGITFPLMAPYTKGYSFLPFVVMVIGFGAFLWVKLPETKGKTYDEISKYFAQEGTSKEGETLLVPVTPNGDHKLSRTAETSLLANGGDAELHISSRNVV